MTYYMSSIGPRQYLGRSVLCWLKKFLMNIWLFFLCFSQLEGWCKIELEYLSAIGTVSTAPLAKEALKTYERQKNEVRAIRAFISSPFLGNASVTLSIFWFFSDRAFLGSLFQVSLSLMYCLFPFSLYTGLRYYGAVNYSHFFLFTRKCSFDFTLPYRLVSVSAFIFSLVLSDSMERPFPSKVSPFAFDLFTYPSTFTFSFQFLFISRNFLNKYIEVYFVKVLVLFPAHSFQYPTIQLVQI